MELQIKDLIDSIKTEGIDAANEEAERIIAEAHKKAVAIVSKAEGEAQSTLEAARREIELLKQSAEADAQQARRDAVLSFKEEIQKEFEKILKADVSKTVSGDALADLIRAGLAGEDVSEYAVELASVDDGIKAALAEEIRNGLEIRPVRGIHAGFRLAAKDGSGFFDCTDEAIAQMLTPYFRKLNI